MTNNMRWLHTEYILKGTFLGLLLFAALYEPGWKQLGIIATLTVGGLAVALGIAAGRKMREGYHAGGQPLPSLLFLILESPVLVYVGILAGMAAGGGYLCREITDVQVLALTAAGGAGLGIVFWFVRTVRERWYRLGLSLLMAVLLVAGMLF